MIVTVHKAKTQLSKLIAAALDGEEVVIARGNQPAVKLTPVNPLGKRGFGSLRGKIAFSDSFFDPLPDDLLALWNGEGD